MPRKPKPETTENEARMLQAITAYRKKEYQSIAAAAAAFGVSRTTLNNRLNGRASRRVSLQHLQALAPSEERELEKWISMLTITGFAPRHALVRQMAESIRQRRLRAINDDIMIHVEYPPLDVHWIVNFLQRHPHLKTIVGQTIESSRIQDILPDTL
jgi:transcriptional regulator with XRE-family HTH domain